MKNYCPNCGNPFNNNDKFCSQCGYQNPVGNAKITNNIPMEEIPPESPQTNVNNIPVSPTETVNIADIPDEIKNSYMYPEANKTPDESKTRLSIVLGVMSIIFSFTFNICGIITSIIGLIKAGSTSKRTPNRAIGLTLNIIALSLCIIIIIVKIIFAFGILKTLSNFEIDSSTPQKEIPISGQYFCQNSSSTVDSGEYTMVIYLYNNSTFTIGEYSDLQHNQANGTYTYKDLNQTVNSNKYKYYEVTLNGYEGSFIYDGEIQNHAYETTFQFALTEKNKKKEGLVYFSNGASMNYCFTK